MGQILPCECVKSSEKADEQSNKEPSVKLRLTQSPGIHSSFVGNIL